MKIVIRNIRPALMTENMTRAYAAAAAAAPTEAKLPDLPYGYGELEPVIAGGQSRK